MREDWVECTLGDLLTLKNGFAFKSSNYITKGIPVIRIGDINDWIVDETQAKCIAENEEYDAYTVKRHDILIAMSGATTGKFGIYKSDNKAYQNQRVGNLRPSSTTLIDKKYIFNLLYSLKFQIEKDAYGGAQPNISAGKIHALSTVLAPLPIQRAIVAKIEELFSALDKGIADLKKAQAQLKIYRQAVLKKAFEGELTNSTSEIQSVLLGDEIKIVSGNTPKGLKLISNTGTHQFYKVSDMNLPGNEMEMKDSNLKLTQDEVEQLKVKKFPKGTIIFPKRGGAILTNKKRILSKCSSFDLNIMGVIPNENYLSNYLYYFFISKDLGKLCDGSAVPQINNKHIAPLEFPKYKIEIQHQIVQEIESRLSVCDKVEQIIAESLEKAKALRQSILKKAFAGSLLSAAEIAACKAAPDYEPASVLLGKIQAEKKK